MIQSPWLYIYKVSLYLWHLIIYMLHKFVAVVTFRSIRNINMTRSPNSICLIDIFVQHFKCLFIFFFCMRFRWILHSRSIGNYSTQVFNKVITCLTSIVVMDIIYNYNNWVLWNLKYMVLLGCIEHNYMNSNFNVILWYHRGIMMGLLHCYINIISPPPLQNGAKSMNRKILELSNIA